MDNQKKVFWGMISAACILLVLVFPDLLNGESKSVPEYPLSAETVEKALEETEVSWTAGQAASPAENQTVYELFDEKGKHIADILSMKEESRALELIFDTADSEGSGLVFSVSENSWKKAFVLGVELYGGFEDGEKLYEEFMGNYEGTGWNCRKDGISCAAEVSVSEDDAKKELMRICFYQTEENPFETENI
ncbi:MAG: hypothetical protein ACI4DV_07460 [Lachnospiraceae bacterium]